jgi:dipeptidyl aminopeptidase/acylaminoacyl peptidase
MASENPSSDAYESEVTPESPVGNKLVVRVVRPGRRPRTFAAAYDELSNLLASNDVRIEEVDAASIEIKSVRTTDGPGIELSITLPGANRPKP